MSNRIDQLEYTVMELGSQVFRLKQELNQLNQSQSTVVSFINNVKNLLEEKGVFDLEEFEIIRDMQDYLDQFADTDAEDSEEDVSKSDLH